MNMVKYQRNVCMCNTVVFMFACGCEQLFYISETVNEKGWVVGGEVVGRC